MPGDLGTITTTQKITGNRVKADDVNNNQISLPSAPIPSFSQPGIVVVQNLIPDPNASPANSEYTFEVVAQGTPSNGQMSIVMQTHLANGNAGKSDTITITVIPDPNTPGPFDHFTVVPGTTSQI